jgi:ribosomal protein S18 acetylase RimI-like enzyme
MTEPRIRPYRPSDRDAVAEVCVRTAAGGGDARGVYSDDLLMPEVYALPYVDHSPELAFVAVRHDDGARGPLSVEDGSMLGYVVAVADTAEFAAWWAREWTPGFVERHPAPGPATGADPGYTEAALLRDGADPDRMLRGLVHGELETHPAHLHVDLVPEAQGRGLGRRLMSTVRAALAERGVPGVHLGHDPANVGARAFYDRLGFVELPSHSPTRPLLGIGTD